MRKVPLSLGDTGRWLYDIASRVNEMIDGRSNAIGEVTLNPNDTSTTVDDLRVGVDSRILLMPTTPNAAAGITTTYIYTVTKQSFTIIHTNTAQIDRTFKYAIVG